MIFGKKYVLTATKKKELEKELKKLETTGRKDIADKLDWLRIQSFSEEDDPFGDVLDDKNFLEKRISELKEILNHSEIAKVGKKHKEVEIGTKVKVGFEGFEEEYVIVSSLEANPLKKRISDESPVGRALLGSKEGDNVEVKIGPVNKVFRIVKIS
ncbi:GreA/GreB family elongation factor [Candidatus Dojkabacteria bacterium]|jgi:transcription elongation factor GreA|nr:GreA/GreB family elongation factor [Candidatus Dojkabacteria bacterium]